MIPEFEVFASVAIAPYRTPGTPEMGQLVGELVDQHNTILMANHGVVSWSHTTSKMLISRWKSWKRIAAPFS